MSFPAYSSLFTSGLLANHVPRSVCTDAHDDADATDALPTRRGSLPDTTHCLTNSVYFARQPKSFLSLDLAESSSAKHSRRTESSISAPSTSASDRFRLSAIRSKSTPSPSPTLSRSSRESLRALPNPKPAPRLELPSVPTGQSPSLRSLSPMTFARSASPLSPAASSYYPETPSSLVSPAPSISVTSEYRRAERGQALARLEARKGVRSNFISLSDDEDTEDECDQEVRVVKKRAQQRIVPIDFPTEAALPDISPIAPSTTHSFPVPSATRVQSQPHSQPASARPLRTCASDWKRHNRQRSMTVSSGSQKSSIVSSITSVSVSASPLRRKFSLKDSWLAFDLVNFMDLRDDRDSKRSSWRSSIVEIPALA